MAPSRVISREMKSFLRLARESEQPFREAIVIRFVEAIAVSTREIQYLNQLGSRKVSNVRNIGVG